MKAIRTYLVISFGVMTPVCALVMLLNQCGFPIYNTALGFVAVALGGVSTAVAGVIVAKRSGKISGYRKVLRDFFELKQPLRNYVVATGFLFVVFGLRIISGKWQENQGLFALPGLFAASILFGGIEEIGWRYLFQPELERKLSFPIASAITFVAWGIWHILFFVVDGSIWLMTPQSLLLFLLGLLGNTFVLGAIYHLSQSLWLCVLYHALLNAFSQTLVQAELAETVVIMVLSALLSILLVWQAKEPIVRERNDTC